MPERPACHMETRRASGGTQAAGRTEVNRCTSSRFQVRSNVRNDAIILTDGFNAVHN